MNPVRLLLVDDHTLFRAGLRALLERVEGVEVVGEAGTGPEALELMQSLRPDVAVVDIALPGMNGLELAARSTRDCPGVRLLMLSMHAAGEYVLQALRTGASGYLVKDAAEAELEVAVRAVAAGQTYLSPSVSQHVVAGAVEEQSPLDRLTPRQRETLKLIAEGHATRAIARLMKISVKTVETHRVQLMERLGIHDVAGLTRFAIRAGLVNLEE